MPGGHDSWNELLWPAEFPMSTNELSILLPHFLLDGRGTLDTYFTRVYNPVWTNPDGMVWEQVLRDETKIELHAALTPTWNETAQYADYVLTNPDMLHLGICAYPGAWEALLKDLRVTVDSADDLILWLPYGWRGTPNDSRNMVRALRQGTLVHQCLTAVIPAPVARDMLDPMALGECRYCHDRLPTTA